jgi:transposase-like protein
MVMKAITRQKCTAEFRKQAVKFIGEQGLKISGAARRLAISDKSLSPANMPVQNIDSY